MPQFLPTPDRRCQATRAERKGGGQCKNAAIYGGRVCRFHGGAAPQTIASARRRIVEAACPAIGVIIELMHDKRVPYAVRLQAARDLADRAGLGAREAIDVDVNVRPEDFKEMVARARARMERREIDNVVEAEVIDDN